VVAAGPYRWVRNPIYLAALLIVLGEAWLFMSLPLLAYAGAIAVFTLQRQRDRQEQDEPGQRPPAAGGQVAVGEQQQDQREQPEDPGEVGGPGDQDDARQGTRAADRRRRRPRPWGRSSE
jgi:hypothetical protein